jgi:transcriptional regulator GlxA family with amidase domain
MTSYPSTRSALPVHYGLLIFPGFQALDVFGPIDLLNLLSHTEHTNLSIIASTLEPVSTQVHGENNKAGSIFAQAIVPTHTLANPPEQLDVLLVPGGFGVDGPRADEIAFIKAVYPRLQYLISVCNGSVLLARAGVLDGRRATTNKWLWTACTSTSAKVDWIPVARWVVDGNIWTASGVSAGIDCMAAFIGKPRHRDFLRGDRMLKMACDRGGLRQRGCH